MVSNGGTDLGEVYWEDEPGRKRVVKRLCRSCRWVPLPPLIRLVSPQGIAHEQGTYMQPEGHTACGKDATGMDWWWRT